MRLEKIEINGFKSFAEKTEILLQGGIIGIVGPNGSGKSNIADAIRWVLGEQSSKNLRGTKMEDVIFNGTQDRRKKAYCEVSLYFDNADMQLAADYSEVVITRKMYRSGESEYLINGSVVRLKDIIELISDTGIGKEGYSIVGQGRVDELLSSKPLARRRVFEEAAGVMKFRLRKEESERKLERTEENLIRIGDVLNELNAQLPSMEEQAEKTRRYLELFEERKRLDSNIFKINYSRGSARQAKLEEELKLVEEEIRALKEEFKGGIERSEALNAELLAAEAALDAKKAQISQASADIEKNIGQKNVLLERMAAVKADMARLEGENAESAARVKTLEEEKAARLAELARLKQEAEELESGLRLLEAEKQLQEKEYANRIAEIKAMRQKHMELLMESSRVASKVSALEAQKESISTDFERFDAYQEEYTLALSEVLGKKEQAESALKKLEEGKTGTVRSYNEANSFLKGYKQEHEEGAKKLEAARGAVNAAISRKALLSNLKAEYEGYSLGVRSFMKEAALDKEVFSGVLGTVAELIDVPREYEDAIEAVLGGAMQHVVVRSESDAKKAIARLRDKRLGKVSFIPMDAINIRRMSPEEKEAAKGCVSLAQEAVRYAEEVRPAVEFLLGRTVIVKDMDAAGALARKTGYGLRVATLGGDFINPGGVITGGSQQARNFGLLSRQREIDDAEAALKESKKAAEEAEAVQKKISEKITEQEESLRILGEELRENDVARARLLSESHSLDQRKKEIEAELSRLHSQREKSASEQEKAAEEKAALFGEQSRMEREAEELLLAISSLERLSSVDLLTKQEQDLSEERVRAAKAHSSVEIAEAGVRRLEEDIGSIAAGVEKRNGELERNRGFLLEAEKQQKELDMQLESCHTRLEKLAKEAEEAQKKRQDVGERIALLQRSGMDYQDKQAGLAESRYWLEGQIERIRLSLENGANKLWEDYSMTYADAEKFDCSLSYAECVRRAGEVRGDPGDRPHQPKRHRGLRQGVRTGEGAFHPEGRSGKGESRSGKGDRQHHLLHAGGV